MQLGLVHLVSAIAYIVPTALRNPHYCIAAVRRRALSAMLCRKEREFGCGHPRAYNVTVNSVRRDFP